MPTKRELWSELGKRYGIPAKGTPEYEYKKQQYQRALIELNISDEQPVRQQAMSHCSCPCYCGGRGQEPPMSHTMGYAEQVPSASAPQPPVSRRPVQQYHPMPEQNFDSDSEDDRRSRKGRRARVPESSSEEESDSDSEYERKQRKKQQVEKLKRKKAADSKKKKPVATKKAQTKKSAK